MLNKILAKGFGCLLLLLCAQLAAAHDHDVYDVYGYDYYDHAHRDHDRDGNGGLPSPFYDGSSRDLAPGAHLTFVGEVVAGRCLSVGQPGNQGNCISQPYLKVDGTNGSQYFVLQGNWTFWANYLQRQVMISAEVRVFQAYGQTWNDVSDVVVLCPLDGSTIEVLTGAGN